MMRLPDPSAIAKNRLSLEAYTIDRVVKWYVLLQRNINQIMEIANGDSEKVGKLMGFAAGALGKTSKVSQAPFVECTPVLGPIMGVVGLAAIPAGFFMSYLSKNANKIKAILKLWNIHNGSGNESNLKKTIIEAGIRIFLSLEIPCNAFGTQYMDLIAMDSVHRLFHYLAENVENLKEFNSETIYDGVMGGKSQTDGVWARITRSRGFQVGELNTRKIFTSPGIVSEHEILKDPVDDKYGFRVKLPFETDPNEFPKLKYEYVLDSQLPSISSWDDVSTKSLIENIRDEVEKRIISTDGLLGKLQENITEQFLEQKNQLDSIQEDTVETRNMIQSFFNSFGGGWEVVENLQFTELKESLMSMDDHLNAFNRIEKTLDGVAEGVQVANIKIDEVSKNLQDGFQRVQEMISTVSSSEKSHKSVSRRMESVMFEVQYPVFCFTGRKSELVKLHEMITGVTTSTDPTTSAAINGNPTVINQISTISGLGGIGKSELARMYAALYRDYYSGNVIWIIAENEGSFRSSFERLLEKEFQVLKEDSNVKSTPELVEMAYEYFYGKSRCLIIFDNVEDFDIVNLLPTSLQNSRNAFIPNVLITSRKATWKFGIQVLSLDVFSSEEAMELVRKLVKGANKDEVRDLVDELQCLPLALQQAAAYIQIELQEDPNRVKTYLQLFKTRTKELLNYRSEGLSMSEKTTFVTWTLTMNNLKTRRSGFLAIRIMNIISFFEPDIIPVSIFDNLSTSSGWSQKLLPSIWQRRQPNFNEFLVNPVKSAVALLKTYSLISGPPGWINVHRLVQRVVQLNLGSHGIPRALKRGLKLLQHEVRIYRRAGNNAEIKSLLHPHAQSIWRYTEKHTKLKLKFASFPAEVIQTLEYYNIVLKLQTLLASREQHQELAVHILSIISFFNPDYVIPVLIFLSDPSCSDLPDKNVKTKTRFDDLVTESGEVHDIHCKKKNVDSAIETLKTHSFVNAVGGELSVHAFVQNVVRMKLGAHNALEEGLELLRKNCYGRNDQEIRAWTSIFPHAESVWRHALKMGSNNLIAKYATFPSAVCKMQMNFSQINEGSLQLARDSIPRLESVLGANHVNTIWIKYWEAVALLRLRKHSRELWETMEKLAKLEPEADHELKLEITKIMEEISLEIDHQIAENLRINVSY